MRSNDSSTNQQTLIGWLANVCSAIFKQKSHSNWSTRRTMTLPYTEKAMQTSTTGYFFKLGFSGGTVSWQTKKQQTAAHSYWEAEYQGLEAAVQEATFLRSNLCEMGHQ